MTGLETLQSYVPPFVVRHWMNAGPASAIPASQSFAAATLFGDISGFTALAERLAEHGPAGVEQLTLLLNEYLGAMVDRVAAHGGEVARFAGDALLALWPCGESDGELRESCLQAARCSRDIQDYVARPLGSGATALSLRMSLGAGRVHAMHLGGVLDRNDYLVAGRPVEQLLEAHHLGQPGGLVASPDAWRLLRGCCRGEDVAGGYVRILNVAGPAPAAAASGPVPSAALADVLRRYVPLPVLSRLEAGQSEWLAELRPIAALFISVPALTPAVPPERAHEIFCAVQTEVFRHGAAVNKVSVGNGCATILAVVGLPPLSPENNAIRALQTALGIRRHLAGMGLGCGIGIASGRAFCGLVGNEKRREYTVIGDAVNLASRLMESTRDDILCDAATALASLSRIDLETLSPMQIRGKAELVPVFRPRVGPQPPVSPPRLQEGERRRRSRPAIIDRRAERDVLRTLLRRLQEVNSGGGVLVEGEAGLGKSRLLEEFCDHARGMGVQVLVGEGDAIDRSTPYRAWRTIVGPLLGTAPEGGPAEPREAVAARLQARLERPELAPLLNPVLALDLPENDQTRFMTGEVRAENTRSLLLEVLGAQAARRPTACLMDDAHWLDPSSWSLLLDAVRLIPAMLVVIASRPVHEPPLAEFTRKLRRENVSYLTLDGLSATDTVEVACRRLGVRTVPDAVAEFIASRAEGNPFFSEELACALKESGPLHIADGKCEVADLGSMSTLNFPETVEGVIVSRIDRLTAMQQLTLKVASVIGRVFPLQLLRDVYPVEGERPWLERTLEELDHLDLTPLSTPPPNATYIFKHSITQEVVYNLMLFAQRQQLHRAVAEWFEAQHAGDLSPFYALLAHHWLRTLDPQQPDPAMARKALEFLERAGEQAHAAYANSETIRLLTQAAELDARCGLNADSGRKARWESRLGEAHLALGDLVAARRHLERALILLGYPAPRGSLRTATGLAAQIVEQAARRLLPAPSAGRPAGDAVVEAARSYEMMSALHFFGHDAVRTLYSALRHVNLAERAGSHPHMARGFASLGYAAAFGGLHSLAERFCSLAGEAARQAQAPPASARVLELVGLIMNGLGRWERALESVQEGARIFESLGDRRCWEECLAILGNTWFFKGDFLQCIDVCVKVHASATRRNDPQARWWGLAGQARGLIALGRMPAALELLGQGEALFKTLQHVSLSDEIEFKGLLAWAHWRQGNVDDALQAAAQAEALIGSNSASAYYCFYGYAAVAEIRQGMLAGPPPVPDPQRWAAARQACRSLARFARVFPVARSRSLQCQAMGHWLAGDRARARVAWEAAIVDAERLRLHYEAARAHAALAGQMDESDPERPLHLEKAWMLFSELGALYDLERLPAVAGSGATS